MSSEPCASEIAISAEQLGKQYLIRHLSSTPYRMLREELTGSIRNLFRGGSRVDREAFWALREVSFTVRRGEILGVIGRNGAGKSTLLKVLSRITPPTEGRVRIRGRVSSLLEVGTGFHPELTGRENIFLNGAILGMGRAEIRRKFDAMVAFAEVEQFLDTPVKRYSSGMYLRLAFSVAAHLDPEILIIDEVLAVGDAQFQRRCLGKIGEIAQSGRTVLFVSHNMAAVARFCTRCLLLERGRVTAEGAASEVIEKHLGGGESPLHARCWTSEEIAPGDGELVRFNAFRILDADRRPAGLVQIERPFFIELDYDILRPAPPLWLGFRVGAVSGETLFLSGDADFARELPPPRLPGRYLSICEIPANTLNQGRYTFHLVGHIPGRKVLVDSAEFVSVEVIQTEAIAGGGIQAGFFRPRFDWQTAPASPGDASLPNCLASE